jgi:hypothetical protein
MGKNHFARLPTYLCEFNFLACALAYYLLQTCLVRLHGPDSLLAEAIGRQAKGKSSPLLCMLRVAGAWFGSRWI